MSANSEQAGGRSGSAAEDVVAQIRQLGGQEHDPAAVQRIVAEVLAALDRAIMNAGHGRPRTMRTGPAPLGIEGAIGDGRADPGDGRADPGDGGADPDDAMTLECRPTPE